MVKLYDELGQILGYLQEDDYDRLGQHNMLEIANILPVDAYTGTLTSGAWRTRPLNSVLKNSIVGASLVNNQIILPKGDYLTAGWFPAYAVNTHTTRLFNITGNGSLIFGTTVHSNTSYSNSMTSDIFGTFSLSEESVVEVQHFGINTCVNSGFGVMFNTAGANGAFIEYLNCKAIFWKLA